MARPRRPRSRAPLAATIVAMLLALLWMRIDPARRLSSLSHTRAPAAAHGAAPSLVPLFEAHASGRVVEGEGRVVAVLRDDREGSRHQRFVLETEPGFTILVSHNVDLAPRIEGLARGDVVAFRGQYEWNEQGGVVHWTHHDPDGRRPGGWLRRDGRTYR